MANLAAFVKTGKLNDLFVKKGKFARTVEWTVSKVITPETQEKISQIIKNEILSDPRTYSSKTYLMILVNFIELIPDIYYYKYPHQLCRIVQFDNSTPSNKECWDDPDLAVDGPSIIMKLFFQNIVRSSIPSMWVESIFTAYNFFGNRNLKLLYNDHISSILEKLQELDNGFKDMKIDNMNYVIGICGVIAFCATAIFVYHRVKKAKPKDKLKGVSIIEGVKTEQELKDLDEQYEKFKIFCTETLGLSEKLALEWNEQFYNFYKPCLELSKTLFDGIILMQ